VKSIFQEWLERTQPTRAERIESLIRSTRDGNLSDSRFGTRFRGTGEIAEQIRQTFKVFSKKCSLDQPGPPLDTTQFRPPIPRSGQMRLF
jgi:hypothetical protein